MHNISNPSEFKAFFFTLLFFLSLQSHAQKDLNQTLHSLDSLTESYKNKDILDSIETRQFYDLSRSLSRFGKHDERIKYSKFIIDVENKINDLIIISEFYSDLTFSLQSKGELDSAISYGIEHSLFLDRIESNPGINKYEHVNRRLFALLNLASYNRITGNFDLYLTHMLEADEIIKNIDVNTARKSFPNFQYGFIYADFAQYYYYTQDYIKSQAAVEKLREEAEAIKNQWLIDQVTYFTARNLMEKRNVDPKLIIFELNKIDKNNLDYNSILQSDFVYNLYAELFARIGTKDSVYHYSALATKKVLLRKNFFNNAIQFEKNIELAKMIDDYEWLTSNYGQLAAYKSIIAKNSNDREIGRLETRLESERSKLQLNAELLQGKNRALIIYLILAIVAILNIILVYYIKSVRKKKAIEAIELERLKTEQELEKTKKIRLKEELNFKERQLTTNVMMTARMNSQLIETYEMLESISNSGTENLIKELRSVIRNLKGSINMQDTWSHFYDQFEQVHPRFFATLLSYNDQLSQNDLRHAACILMNLSNKEVASIYNTTDNSVKIARNRLKKKLGLEPDQSLLDFLHNLNNKRDSEFLQTA